MSRALRVALPLLIAAVVLAIAAWIRLDRRAAGAIAESDAAYARGEREGAIALARVAAECAPTGGSDTGFARLARIAQESEKRGDDATAAAEWRATRSAAIATRDPARRAAAEKHVARLGARQAEKDRAQSPTLEPRATEERLGAVLARPEGPSGATTALFAVGLVVFAGGALRAFGRRDRAGWRAPALAAAAGAALCVVGALVG